MHLLENIDALLITNPTNIRYLTEFVGAAPEEREAFLLVLRKKAYLLVNSLYKEQAKSLIWLHGSMATWLKIQTLETRIFSREEPIEKKLKEILKRSHLAALTLKGETFKGIYLEFEESDLTVAEFAKLKKALKGMTLVPTKDRIEKLRVIKREDEIGNIRAAAKLTDQCFDFILGKLKPGVTETEIAWEIEAYIRKQGIQLAFSPIVAFGKNTSQPHYSPDLVRSHLARQGETLRKNEIVLLDFGAKVNGYCSDMTRVVFVGKPKKEWEMVYEVVCRAQQAALQYLHPEGVKAHLPGGVQLSGAQADRVARVVIKKAGFLLYPHSLGHGVGLSVHEAPRLTIRKDAILLPGMVFTLEPAIYVEGQFGIRIEDLVVLKKDGVEILSKSPKNIPAL